jgi:hypothetical protein
MKTIVEGIILVLSCQKHKETRLKEFKLPKDDYLGWKVIYVLGDFFLPTPYVLEKNVMTIQCEDSYLHLLKKLILAITCVYEEFEVKQGVLRCGDDLLFHEERLCEFLQKDNKPHFYGNSPSGKSYLRINKDELQDIRIDTFMVIYYMNHPEDFTNPHHNLKNVHIEDYVKRPRIRIGPEGTLYYISNKCCTILMNHFKEINYNIFHFDEFSQSYPYTIEDCAVSFILYFHGVPFLHDPSIVANYYWNKPFSWSDYNTIAVATNKYK